jgi:hypothetical protein
MAHRRRWWTCFTSGIVNFVNKSSGCSRVGAWGFREDAKNDAFRNGRGEVGVWELDKEDSCGIALESGCNSADEDGGEEREGADNFRAMRVGHKTRPRERFLEAPNCHTHNTTLATLSRTQSFSGKGKQ